MFITGSGGQQADVTNDANQSLTDAPCPRLDTWLEDKGGHTASWAEKTVKARCLPMEWQVPEAVKKHPQERNLDFERGVNSLDSETTTRAPCFSWGRGGNTAIPWDSAASVSRQAGKCQVFFACLLGWVCSSPLE